VTNLAEKESSVFTCVSCAPAEFAKAASNKRDGSIFEDIGAFDSIKVKTFQSGWGLYTSAEGQISTAQDRGLINC
jgi:hypothetical protein